MMTSIEAARFFKVEHRIILRLIRGIRCSNEFYKTNFIAEKYKDDLHREMPRYQLTQAGFELLAMRVESEVAANWRERYILARGKHETTRPE